MKGIIGRVFLDLLALIISYHITPWLLSCCKRQFKSYMWIHLAIQNCVISFASSTRPMSSKSWVVPLTALSRALKIQAWV
jgi:hypothetical protein